MPLNTGLAAQIGVKAESVWGTAVTVDRFFPIDPDGIKLGGAGIPELLRSKAVIAGRTLPRGDQRASGNITPTPSFGFELYDRSIALLWTHILGSNATTGAGPYTHTATPGDLVGKSLTIQAGVPDVAGTVQPFTFAGCKIGKAQLACKAGEIATMGIDVVARSVTTATALATASIASTINPMTFVQGTLSIGGSSVNVEDFTLDIDNVLDGGFRSLGSQTITREPTAADHRKIMGKGTLEFSGLTQFNRHNTNAQAAVVLTFTLGANSVTITMNGLFTGGEPQPSRGVTKLPFEFECVGSTDAAAITVVTVNGDAAA